MQLIYSEDISVTNLCSVVSWTEWQEIRLSDGEIIRGIKFL